MGDGPDSGGRGRGGGGGIEPMQAMSLKELAEKMLDSFRQSDRDEPSAGIVEPEDSLIGGEVLSYPFVFNGRNRKITIHRALLKASHDFQLGCVYGMLAQRLGPKMFRCEHCGKVKEPTYGFDHGIVVDLLREGRQDRCE